MASFILTYGSDSWTPDYDPVLGSRDRSDGGVVLERMGDGSTKGWRRSARKREWTRLFRGVTDAQKAAYYAFLDVAGGNTITYVDETLGAPVNAHLVGRSQDPDFVQVGGGYWEVELDFREA